MLAELALFLQSHDKAVGLAIFCVYCAMIWFSRRVDAKQDGGHPVPN